MVDIEHKRPADDVIEPVKSDLNRVGFGVVAHAEQGQLTHLHLIAQRRIDDFYFRMLPDVNSLNVIEKTLPLCLVELRYGHDIIPSEGKS